MSKMTDSVLDNPFVLWNPNDIAGWRRAQFAEWFTGVALLDFLADSRIDLHLMDAWIRKGATPYDAVRLEAGRTFDGDDVGFDHRQFDALIERWKLQNTPVDPDRVSLLFGSFAD